MDVFNREKEAVLCQGLNDYVNQLKVQGYDTSLHSQKRFTPFVFGKEFIQFRGGILKELVKFYEETDFAEYLEKRIATGFRDYQSLERYQQESGGFAETCLKNIDNREDSFGLHFLAASSERCAEYAKIYSHSPFDKWSEREVFFLLAAAERDEKILLGKGFFILQDTQNEDAVRLYLRTLVWLFQKWLWKEKMEDPEALYQILFDGFFPARAFITHEETRYNPDQDLLAEAYCCSPFRQVLLLLLFVAAGLSRYLAKQARKGFSPKGGGFDFYLTTNLMHLQSFVEENEALFVKNGGAEADELLQRIKKYFQVWNQKNVQKFLKKALRFWANTHCSRDCVGRELRTSPANPDSWSRPLAVGEYMTSVLALDMDQFWADVQTMAACAADAGVPHVFQHAYPRIREFYPCIGALSRVLQVLRRGKLDEEKLEMVRSTLSTHSAEELCREASAEEKAVLRILEEKVKAALEERRRT